MVRKVIVRKFNFFLILKLWEFGGWHCKNVCKSGVSSTKNKFEWDTSNRHKGIQCGFSSLNSFIFCCAIYGIQLSKLNGLGKTHRKRLCSRTETFARPFTTNKLFEEDSDNKWRKVPLINSIVTNYLTF